jgi:Icc protein
MNVAFQHKGVQFICLDWGAQPKAVASPELFDFLSQALESELPSVILTHHHLVPIGSRWLDEFIADDIDQFWEIVTAPGVSHKVLGMICGHVHMTYEEQVAGIPVLGLRSTAFPFAHTDEPLRTLQPPHYRLVTIQDGILTSRIYEVPL